KLLSLSHRFYVPCSKKIDLMSTMPGENMGNFFLLVIRMRQDLENVSAVFHYMFIELHGFVFDVSDSAKFLGDLCRKPMLIGIKVKCFYSFCAVKNLYIIFINT